jgi:hypothetical protein
MNASDRRNAMVMWLKLSHRFLTPDREDGREGREESCKGERKWPF